MAFSRRFFPSLDRPKLAPEDFPDLLRAWEVDPDGIPAVLRELRMTRLVYAAFLVLSLIGVVVAGAYFSVVALFIASGWAIAMLLHTTVLTWRIDMLENGPTLPFAFVPFWRWVWAAKCPIDNFKGN